MERCLAARDIILRLLTILRAIDASLPESPSYLVINVAMKQAAHGMHEAGPAGHKKMSVVQILFSSVTLGLLHVDVLDTRPTDSQTMCAANCEPPIWTHYNTM